MTQQLWPYRWTWDLEAEWKGIGDPRTEIMVQIEREIRRKLVEEAIKQGITLTVDSIYVDLKRVQVGESVRYIGRAVTDFRCDVPPTREAIFTFAVPAVIIAFIEYVLPLIIMAVIAYFVYLSLSTIKSTVEVIPPEARVPIAWAVLGAVLIIGGLLVTYWLGRIRG